MTAFLIENMAPLMFAAMVVFLLLGYPVAFALAANGMLFGVIGIELGLFSTNFFQAMPERLFGIMANDTLLAIPFFTFMGLVLERSGMAEDLLETIGQLFGPLRGGLAYAVVFVGALLAATTGVVAASVISMGLISLPIMLRYGYDPRLATGVIAASGTLAQIIPPSLVLIVMADQIGRSVGDMYAGALIPGLVLTGFYAIYVFVLTLVFPKRTPALPLEARTFREESGRSGVISLLVVVGIVIVVSSVADVLFIDEFGDNAIIMAAVVGVLLAFGLAGANRLFKLGLVSRLAEKVIFVLVPPLALIFLVLGTIFLGIATPTEGGAMGATGALLLALSNRRLSFSLLRQAMDSTAKLTSFVIFILVGSTVFGLVFRGVDGDLWVEELLLSLPGGVLGFLIVVNLIVFLLAFFLEFFELTFIVVPLLAPVAATLGIDLVWFGVLLAVNMQTSFLTPPVGFSLFYLRSVAPAKSYVDRVSGKLIAGVSTMQIYRGAMPFVAIQVVMIALVIAFPEMVLSGIGKGTVVDPSTIRIEMPPLPGQDGPAPPIQFK